MPRSVIRVNDGVLPWALVTQVGAKGDTGSGGTGITDGDKGDVTVASSGSAWTIKNAAVTNAKIANDAVDAAKIATGAVGSGELASGAVTTAKIADDSVTVAKLGADVDAALAAKADVASTPTLDANNAWTGTNTFPDGSLSASAIANLDTRFDNYVSSKGLAYVRTFANGTTPTITPNTLWLELGAGVTPTPAASLVMHQGSTVDQATYVFTPENSMPSAPIYLLAVWGGTVDSSAAPKASSISGRSLTWTAIGTGVNQSNTTTSLIIYKGVGTPDASGSVSVTFPSAVAGCQVELVAVSNVSSTVTASAYNGQSGTFTAPTVSLGSAPNSAHFQVLFLGVNSGSSTINTDPGTPFGTSPDVTISSPSLKTRASFRSSAQQTSTWAQSASAQSTTASIVLTPA